MKAEIKRKHNNKKFTKNGLNQSFYTHESIYYWSA